MAKIRSTIEMFHVGQRVGQRFDKRERWIGTVTRVTETGVWVRWDGKAHTTGAFLANELRRIGG